MSYEKHLSKRKSTSYCEFLMSSRTLLAPFTRASLMLLLCSLLHIKNCSQAPRALTSQELRAKGIRNADGDKYYKDNYMFGIQAEAWW